MGARSNTDLRAAAAMMLVGFEGTTPSPEFASFIRSSPPAGVIFFRRNFEDTTQIAALVRQIRALWPSGSPAPLLAIDQEGGRVRRLKAPHCPEFASIPAMAKLGAVDDPKLTEAVGALTGRQLASLGFNLNFAPVLDVDSNPDNPIIGDRAFGADPERVIRHGLAFARGLHAAGVVACGKHFPGHGDTDVDSHLALPRLSHDIARLHACELPPFAAAVAADIPMIMSAHVVFSALDDQVPATLSPTVIPQILRDEMGYDGVVVSDDLEMNAIASHFTPNEVAALGLAAGIDLFLVCRDLTQIVAVRDALAQHLPSRPTVAEGAMRRLTRLRAAASDHAAATYPPEVAWSDDTELLRRFAPVD